MVTRMRGRGMVLSVLAGAGLTACSSSPPRPAPVPPPLIIGSAPAAPTGHIKTDQPVDQYTGYAETDQWPSACGLLTDKDIKSVFPQVTGTVKREASEQDFEFPDGGKMYVPNANCTLQFQLPGGGDGASVIQTAVKAVGDPGTVRLNGETDETVAPSCAYHSRPVQDLATAYVCGRIEFSIDLSLLLPAWGTDDPDRFELGGKVAKFDPADDLQAEEDFEDVHITAALVKAVIEKLPRT